MYERLNEVVAEISRKTGENIAVEFKSGKISINTIRSGKIIIKGNINKVLEIRALFTVLPDKNIQ